MDWNKVVTERSAKFWYLSMVCAPANCLWNLSSCCCSYECQPVLQRPLFNESSPQVRSKSWVTHSGCPHMGSQCHIENLRVWETLYGACGDGIGSPFPYRFVPLWRQLVVYGRYLRVSQCVWWLSVEHWAMFQTSRRLQRFRAFRHINYSLLVNVLSCFFRER